MKNIIKIICFTLVFSPAALFAQKAGNTTKTSPAAKVKIYSTIGGLVDSSSITVQDAERLIAMPIVVQDAKKLNYPISSYQFMYIKRVVTEEEGTGKVTPTTSMVADIFKTTPLSPIWVKSVQEQVKPGEELFFFDIIVKGSAGKLHYAPSLRLLVR